MKNITDYFASPQKKTEATCEDAAAQVIEIEPESDKNGGTGAKKRKKKKKRKVSDPAVRDVTQLLCENLKFSPNENGPKKRSSVNESFIKTLINDNEIIDSDSPIIMKENQSNNGKNRLIKESKLKNIQTKKHTIAVKVDLEVHKSSEKDGQKTSDGSNNVHKDNKVNAFQFLMDMRNKSIGMNSPGKELDKHCELEQDDHKEKLAARRDLFMNWSEQKGGAKRKRLEEEKDEIIEKKLRVRAKRLKKLLKFEESEKKERVGRKKRIVRIASSSEGSDFEDVEIKSKVKKDSNENQSLKKRTTNRQLKEDVNVGTKKKVERKKKTEHNSTIQLPDNSEEKSVLNNTNIEENKNKKRNINCEEADKNMSDISQNSNIKEDNKDYTNEKKSNSIKPEINNGIKKTVKTIAGSILAFVTVDKCKEVFLEDEILEEPVKKGNTVDKTKLEDNAAKKKRKYTKRSKRVTNNSKSAIISLDESSRDTNISIKEQEVTIEVKESNQDVMIGCTRRSSRLKIKEEKNEEKKSAKTSTIINYAEQGTSDESDTDEVLSLSEDDKKKAVPKKNVKLAPIFSKALPKPKEDPAIVEARKQFLLSGLPSSLKKTIEKQNSIIEQQDSFPITQHIQQKCDSSFWTLPQCELKVLAVSPLKIDSNLICEKLTKRTIVKDINIDTEVKKVDKLKLLLNKIKAENPHYPVYKSFRQIREKSGQKLDVTEETTKTSEKKRKRNKKKEKQRNQEMEADKTEIESVEYNMWTEKYKPKCANDIIGNAQAIKNLKKWLEDWKQFSQEINSKKRRLSISSESEFEKTDCDSRESSVLPGKIIILTGPCGSGKTTAVYALCNELEFNVIELNASSKRTGKRLLQEIQEATQSHQVRNKESQSFQTFFKSNSQTEKNDNSEKSSKKMCALLVEDVDIVFEQDEGFINALLQLSATSKRPIIATTTDYNSLIVQKFSGMFECIEFAPLPSFVLSTWLQILFLVEGLYVSRDEIGSLLEYNKGDVRKTLLQFQFWVQSGGQLQQNRSLIKLEYSKITSDERLNEDVGTEESVEKLNTTEETCAQLDVFEHKHCFGSFEILETEEQFRIPFYLNLGLLWWNLPSILHIPNVSDQRIHSTENGSHSNEEPSKDLKQKNLKDIQSIGKVFDALSYVDVTFRRNNFVSAEPLRRFSVVIKDSLELSEVLDSHRDLEFVHELTHYLVNGCISNCRTVDDERCGLNLTMPDKTERRWRSKIDKYESAFNEAIPLTTARRDAALDYMPALRNIARSEFLRASNNTKRGNRFRYYLRDIGINTNDSLIKSACETLNNSIE